MYIGCLNVFFRNVSPILMEYDDVQLDHLLAVILSVILCEIYGNFRATSCYF